MTAYRILFLADPKGRPIIRCPELPGLAWRWKGLVAPNRATGTRMLKAMFGASDIAWATALMNDGHYATFTAAADDP